MKYFQSTVNIIYIHSQLYLLTALIEYLTILLEYVSRSFCKLGGRAQQAFERARGFARSAFGYAIL